MFSHVALIRLRRGQERFHSARPGSAPDAAGLSAPPGSSSSRHLPAPGSGSSSRRCAEQRERETIRAAGEVDGNRRSPFLLLLLLPRTGTQNPEPDLCVCVPGSGAVSVPVP